LAEGVFAALHPNKIQGSIPNKKAAFINYSKKVSKDKSIKL
jgi:hypothetical protein